MSRLTSPTPSGVSQVDPVEPVEVAVNSGAARGAEPAGVGTGGAEPGGPPGVPSRRETLSPQGLREWYVRHCCHVVGATGPAAGGSSGGAAGARAAGGASGAGAAGGAAGARAAGGASGAGAAGGAAGAGAAGAAAAGGGRAAGPGGARIRGTAAAGAGGAAGDGAVARDLGAEGTGAISAVSGGATQPRPYYVPLLQQVFGLPPSTGPTPPLLSPPPIQGLTERCESESRSASPESRPESPVCAVRTGRRVPRQRPPPVPDTHSMTLRHSSAPQRVPLPSPPASSLPDGPDPESDSLRAASPTVTRFLATAVTDPSFESTAASSLVAELVDFAAACRLDYAASLVAESESASVCPPSVGGECALGTDVLENRQEEFECFAAAVPHLIRRSFLDRSCDLLFSPTLSMGVCQNYML
ncbi:unnamed protein product [Closterium sp. NIES-53]